MAAESSRFFDSVNHDRQYAAADFAAYFGETGVYDAACGGDGLRVERAAASSLRVLPGEARIKGYGYWLEAEEDEPFTMLVSRPSRYPRIDRVVLRLDTRLSERSAFLTLKQGTASSAPQPPALTREGDIYEISLAQVYLSPDRSLLATDITDEREDGEVCGALYRNGQIFPFCNNTVWDMHTVFTPGVYYTVHPNGGAPTTGVDPYMVLVSPVSNYATAEQGYAQLWFDLVENKMYVRSTLGNNGAYGAFQPYPDASDRYWSKNTPIPSSGLDTTTDAAKIKLANLATEVLQAMAGDTPVTAVVPDGSITTAKLADGAVAGGKLAAGSVTEAKIANGAVTRNKLGEDIFWNYVTADFNTLTDYGLYVVRANGNAPSASASTYALIVISDGNTLQLAIPNSTSPRLYIRSLTAGNWSEWRDIAAVPIHSITSENMVAGALTTSTLADGAVTADKLATDVIPSELPADKLLAGAGGRAMQATPYAIRQVESVLRIAKDTAGMPPKTISVPLLSSYAGDTPCSLYFEARAVSGSSASLSPAGNSDAGFISGWTTSGVINNGDWGAFSVENQTGFTGLSILLSSDQAASVDFRNVRVVDAAGIDYVDHATFEAQGTIMEDFPDMPETDATDIPTVAGVKALLAALEARVAALEGGGE